MALSSAFIVTTHVVDVPALLHAPPQLSTFHPLAGAAVSVTDVPEANVALSDAPLADVEIPDGLEVTAPLPLLETVSL